MDVNDELTWQWVKSKEGQDHYMHALGYLHVACQLAPTASKNMSLGGFPVAMRLKVRERKEVRIIGSMR